MKPKVQAKYLRQTYKLAAANRNRLKIAGVFWYTFKDLPSRIWIDNTGLFTTGGSRQALVERLRPPNRRNALAAGCSRRPSPAG